MVLDVEIIGLAGMLTTLYSLQHPVTAHFFQLRMRLLRPSV